MIEKRGNIFNEDCDALCITTNGFVKKNREAVMGRGCALEAAKQLPILPKILGYQLITHGNQVHYLTCVNTVAVVSFPVKPIEAPFVDGLNVVRHMVGKFKEGDYVPGWALQADPCLIANSCLQLVKMTDAYGWKKVVLPRPGCGAGELKWDDIMPILEERLDDRFVVMTY